MRENKKNALAIKIASLLAKASANILSVYKEKHFNVRLKSDNSPVTRADRVAHETLIQGLESLTPKMPILSEEGSIESQKHRKNWDMFWLIDPLDGTKEFIARTDEFTINVALIKNHIPIMGFIMVPVTNMLYFGVQDKGAFSLLVGEHKPKPIKALKWDAKKSLCILSSRRHAENRQMKNFLSQLPYHSILQCGSALKFCWLACGKGDLYPRFGPTSEWDTAAGQCLLEAAGGKLYSFDNKPFRYNMRDTLRNRGFVAVADKSIWGLSRHIVDN